jgi:hypothetical protein
MVICRPRAIIRRTSGWNPGSGNLRARSRTTAAALAQIVQPACDGERLVPVLGIGGVLKQVPAPSTIPLSDMPDLLHSPHKGSRVGKRYPVFD